MFDGLQQRLSGILDKLKGRGALSESDVNEALREVRRALLEADVALDVVRPFIDKVRARAVGQEVIRSVTPARWSSRSSMTCWSRCSAPRPIPSTSMPRRRSRS